MQNRRPSPRAPPHFPAGRRGQPGAGLCACAGCPEAVAAGHGGAVRCGAVRCGECGRLRGQWAAWRAWGEGRGRRTAPGPARVSTVMVWGFCFPGCPLRVLGFP